MATNNGKFAPEHKKPGDLILSDEWNAGMQEAVRLESAKVNRQGGDSLEGPLTIASALAVDKNSISVQLEVKGALKLADGVAVNQFSSEVLLHANSDSIVPTQKAVKTYVDTAVKGRAYLDFQAKDLRINGNLTAVSDITATGSLKFVSGVAVNEFSDEVLFTANSDSIVPTQKAVKTYVDKAVTTLNTQVQSGIVKGMIVMWSGQSNQIPKDWAMCNGQNGTPDLRDRFILGAYETGSPQTPKSMESGGPDQHSHSIVSRSLSTSTEGAHLHAWCTKSNISTKSSSIGFNTPGDLYVAGGSDYHQFPNVNGKLSSYLTSNEGAHSHSLNFEGVMTANSTGNNRPKWYALCFIIKL